MTEIMVHGTTLATDNPLEPVVVFGQARHVTAADERAAMLAAENAGYQASYGMEMVDPAVTSVFAMRPDWLFALDAADFTGSPTCFESRPLTGPNCIERHFGAQRGVKLPSML
jgi:hypothetical protein